VGILEDALNRWGVQRSDLTGASLTAELPFRDALLNRLIARRIADHQHLAGVQISSRDGDDALVTIQPRSVLLPSVDLLLHIEKQPELPSDPTLRLRWAVPGTGVLGRFAGPLLMLFKKLPDGVVVDGDLIVIDLHRLLRGHGHDDVVSVVRRLSIHTRLGVVMVRFETGV
jgi:hypothetical protein